MDPIERLTARLVVYAAVVALVAGTFLATALSNGFRLPDPTRERVAVTPATTVSRFLFHFLAPLFHNNLAHIGFNLTLFSLGFWLATRRMDPATAVASAYGVGVLTVFLMHLFVVLPLATLGLPYATGALHRPLVGFSVIAYATLGAGLTVLPRTAQVALAAGIVLFELGAGILVTAPFISAYHVGGLALGFYVRWLTTHTFA